MVGQIAPGTQQTQKIDQLTLDDFMQHYDQEGPFEYINGEIIQLSPNQILHSLIAKTLYDSLRDYTHPRGLGELFFELTFVLLDQPNWVKGLRVPDLMFYRAERYTNYKAQNPDWCNQPAALVPDLAVEIVSPTDLFTAVQNKAALYLKDGVPLIWAVDPSNRSVIVHRVGTNQQITLGDADKLEGSEIIPGFAMSLKQLFDAE